MQVRLLVVGPTQERSLEALIATYMQRIRHYLPFTLEVIPDITPAALRKDPERLKVLEGEQILKRLRSGEEVLLLDEKGTEPTSRELASLLQKRMLSGAKRWTWIVGGAYGFSPAVYEAVPQRISLSRLTLTHTMVRLLAIEQLYRALTILNNEPYHHD